MKKTVALSLLYFISVFAASNIDISDNTNYLPDAPPSDRKANGTSVEI